MTGAPVPGATSALPRSSPARRQALVIVGKAPLPGEAKTRLCPPLRPEQAARLYGAFLADTTRLALRLDFDRVTLVYPPRAGAEQLLGALLPESVALLAQAGSGLGEALPGAFRTHFGAGFDRVVLIGSDNPTLPGEIVQAAATGLDAHDVMLGPSSDGGYYLVAMDRLHPKLFENIAWSTDVVLSQTLARARQQGLRVGLLPGWYDVDTVAELRRLQHDLGELPGEVAPATRRALSAMESPAELRGPGTHGAAAGGA